MSPREAARPVLFGIGLNKTGTTSLGSACELLGYRAFHHETRMLRSAHLTRLVGEAIDADNHPFSKVPSLRRYDAFFDVRAVERHFDKLDRHFPAAKFILHTRDVERWLDSREKHVRRNLNSKRDTWTVVDRDAWREQFLTHHDRVRAYFQKRPDDLLEIDVTRNPSWAPLCDFLNVSPPDQPFPRENTAEGSAMNRPARAARKILRKMKMML